MRLLAGFLSLGFLIISCGSTNIVATPIENIDAIPLKVIATDGGTEKTMGAC